ncbi:MAG: hypothetical protein LBE16_03965, partial [Clostridiales Family XIII bacterium]|nr:hypothetical protein [Clostridiales Family XIII bacterium]
DRVLPDYLAPGAYTKLREEANIGRQVPRWAKIAWGLNGNRPLRAGSGFAHKALLYRAYCGILTIGKHGCVLPADAMRRPGFRENDKVCKEYSV